MSFEAIKKCRVCGSENLHLVLDLGHHPLANALKKSPEQREIKYPLTLLLCSECRLAQTRETVEKELLFQKYVWVTGTSSTARNFAQDFSQKIRRIQAIKKSDLILEIASNDGTFLKPFLEAGLNAIGVDPAENIAALANKRGIKTINAFWNEESAKRIQEEQGQAKVIIARNVIPHVSDLHNVIAEIEFCLRDDGFGAIEFHYAGNILEQLQYDAIYHEHLCYFTLQTLKRLLTMHHLHPFHVDQSPISGGACIVYFSKNQTPPTAEYLSMNRKEIGLEFNEKSSWDSFAERCTRHREKSWETMKDFDSKNIVGFGASARSSTYLNFCGFTRADFPAIVDNSALKRGLYTPGSTVPIVSFDEGMGMNPELIFLLAWNFRDEIVNICRDKGYSGKFLVPFPEAPYLM